MKIKKKTSDIIDAYVRSGHVPAEVDEDLYQSIQENLGGNDERARLLRVRPFPDNSGIEGSEELFQAMHDLRTRLGLINTSNRIAFELWFNEGTVQFLFYTVNKQQEQKLRRQIDAHYPNADIVEEDTLFPGVYQNDWVAGAELRLKESKYYPIKNPQGVREMRSDPYRSITSDMLAAESDRIVIQSVIRPALGTWTHGGALGYINPLSEDIFEVADDFKGEQRIPDATTKDSRKATSEERQLGENIARQEGLPAYHVNLRIFSFSPDKSRAKSNVWGISRTYEQAFQEAGGQQFKQVPLGGYELKEMLKDSARRELYKQGVILTIPELATVAHIPNQSIETPAVDWNNTQATARIPAGAERFDQQDGTGGEFSVNDDQPLEEQKESGIEVPGEHTSEVNDPPIEDSVSQQADQHSDEEYVPPSEDDVYTPPGVEADSEPDPSPEPTHPEENRVDPVPEAESYGETQTTPESETHSERQTGELTEDSSAEQATPPVPEAKEETDTETVDDSPRTVEDYDSQEPENNSPDVRPVNDTEEVNQGNNEAPHDPQSQKTSSAGNDTQQNKTGIFGRLASVIGYESGGFTNKGNNPTEQQSVHREQDATQPENKMPERPETDGTYDPRKQEKLEKSYTQDTEGIDETVERKEKPQGKETVRREPQTQTQPGESYPDQNDAYSSHTPASDVFETDIEDDNQWETVEESGNMSDEEPTVDDINDEFDEEFRSYDTDPDNTETDNDVYR